MPKGCPNCVIALEELVQKIRTMTTKKYLSSSVAKRLELEIQEAIAESKKATPDSKLIVGKLIDAKILIEGISSASDLLNNFNETTTKVTKYLQ